MGTSRVLANVLLIAVPSAAALVGGKFAIADRIVLRGGGSVAGKVLPDPERPDGVLVLMERGRHPLRLTRAQVLRVIDEPGALDEYLDRKRAATATAEGQYELGLWCEGRRLHDLATMHYEAALTHDKSHAAAHKKLGHQEINGEWLGGDALREAQGLVKYKGKWITRDEREQRSQEESSLAERSGWVRRIEGWRDSILRGTPDRRREAEAQLMAIRDPAAVDPLRQVLGAGDHTMRGLLAKTLGAIPGPEATRGLVRSLLVEKEEGPRGSFMVELGRRAEDDTAGRDLVQALRSSDTAIVNRAAWALSHLNDRAAVPALVDALVTRVGRMELVRVEGSTPTLGGFNPGSGLPGPAFGFTYAAPPIAYNGSSVAYLTGPVVGPGAVAFGATSAPVVPLPPDPLSGLTTPSTYVGGPGIAGLGIGGGGGLGASRGPMPQAVTYTIRNSEVHSALIKLTGQDFGYDQPAWREWQRTSFRAEPVPARRVPQP